MGIRAVVHNYRADEETEITHGELANLLEHSDTVSFRSYFADGPEPQDCYTAKHQYDGDELATYRDTLPRSDDKIWNSLADPLSRILPSTHCATDLDWPDDIDYDDPEIAIIDDGETKTYRAKVSWQGSEEQTHPFGYHIFKAAVDRNDLARSQLGDM